MADELEALRKQLADEEGSLEKKDGHMVRFSKAGPTSIMLIQALAAVAEAQSREIEDLKRRVEVLEREDRIPRAV